MNIFGNEKADKIAKYAAENLEPNNIGISISFIKRKLKEKSLLEWELNWQKALRLKKLEEDEAFARSSFSSRLSSAAWQDSPANECFI